MQPKQLLPNPHEIRSNHTHQFYQLSCFLDTSSLSVSGLGHKKVHAPNMEEKYKETHCSHYNNPQTNRKQHPTSYWRYNATDRTELDYPYHVGSSLSSGQMIDSSLYICPQQEKKHAATPARRGTTWNKTKGLNGNNAKILHVCQYIWFLSCKHHSRVGTILS